MTAPEGKAMNFLISEKRQDEKEGLKFDAIRVGLASPEMIRTWSKGEVKKPETINYRTFKPERDGLFCERIFGPTKDWECNCGKYRKIKHKDVICDRCGVEVIQAKVRRERMGHIELAAPVCHIWYLKGVPSRIGYMLEMSVRDLERVIYYESYIVINPGKAPIEKKQLLTEERERELRKEYPNMFKAKMGAEAIRELLRDLNLDDLSDRLREKLKQTSSKQKKKDINKRLGVVEAFKKSRNRAEWMVLEVLPVIPPEIRPLVPLDGGRFATSDLNDLLRRVINRNNRLRKLLDLRAPDVIVRNEKRMLQEAVDALFDNGRRGHVVKGPGNRPLKSLSDMLKGKQGRFRQNLLGKRVDYSGRSVIVVGPELKLNECGLPKKMALELFKPFIIKKLEERGYVYTVKSARKIVEQERPEVWDILAEVIENHLVLLNRAPTLHRQGIQAFQPVLIEGKAIKIHPLVCQAYNADFDGDQMAVHVPLSVEAQLEARLLMLSTNNILSTAHGGPIVTPTQDIVLGCAYLTKPLGAEPKSVEEIQKARHYSSGDEAMRAYEEKIINLHEWIVVRIGEEKIVTTAGRVTLNEIVPKGLGFVNQTLSKTELSALVAESNEKIGVAGTTAFLDSLKSLGFKWATKGGLTVAIDDMKIPASKPKLLEEAREKMHKVEDQYKSGFLTYGERYNRIIDIWTQTADQVADDMMEELKADQDGFNPVYMMSDSGARGSKMQIRQLAGMRGLMAKPLQRITGGVGEIIESPVTSNFREGLTMLEYFISTHGARKGLADTALKTADAGYLTRRLVDVAQDVIITIEDCGTISGVRLEALQEGMQIIEPLKDRIAGRVALDNVVDLVTDEIIVRTGELISQTGAQKIADNQEAIRVRSVLTCEAPFGACAKCYGRDLGTGQLVKTGAAVGIIAAQSIGEPGTQLTLRTFHIGGTASRSVEMSRVVAKNKGTVRFFNMDNHDENREGHLIIFNRNAEIVMYDDDHKAKEHYPIPFGAIVHLRDGDKVVKGTLVSVWDPYNRLVYSRRKGTVQFLDIEEGVTMQEKVEEATGQVRKVIIRPTGVGTSRQNKHPRILILEGPRSKQPLATVPIPTGAQLLVEPGDQVHVGDVLAKISREVTRTRDITGGLPRVSELFEAREPKDAAMISEIDGTVQFREIAKGKQNIAVINEDGTEREYAIPQGIHMNVQDGDKVEAGEVFFDGPINPKDILAVKGEAAVQNYLVSKVQEVYRLEGVPIDDKHLEVIVRQMLRKVTIENTGGTELLEGALVDRRVFRAANEVARKAGKKPATASLVLQGITKSALSTESFISAASFQESTRVLTEAALSGKVDHLLGLKENVIMGHLISAGTGMPRFRNLRLDGATEVPKEASKEGLEPAPLAKSALASTSKEPVKEAEKEA